MTSYKALYTEAKREWAYDVARIEDMEQTIERLTKMLESERQVFAAHRSANIQANDLAHRNEVRRLNVEIERLHETITNLYEMVGRITFTHRNCGGDYHG